jgi:hypothetical protein
MSQSDSVLTQEIISLPSFKTVRIPPLISFVFWPSLLVSVALFAALNVLSREAHIADKHYLVLSEGISECWTYLIATSSSSHSRSALCESKIQ